MKREEFGVKRTSCSCKNCQLNCEHLPGYLIPSDLGRLVGLRDPFVWARVHLRASPGAKVRNIAEGKVFRVPTLVPTHRADGSCHYLVAGKCTVHADAPFGCSFFGCGAIRENYMAHEGIHAVVAAWCDPDSLYVRLWQYLFTLDLVCPAPEEKRDAMRKAFQEGRV